MNQLQLFLPCAAGVEALLATEVQRVTGISGKAWRAGVQLQGSWRDALQQENGDVGDNKAGGDRRHGLQMGPQRPAINGK